MYRRSEYEDDILKAVYMPEVGQRPSSRFRTTFAQQCRARTQPDLSRGNLRRGAPDPLHPCPAQLGRGYWVWLVPHRVRYLTEDLTERAQILVPHTGSRGPK